MRTKRPSASTTFLKYDKVNGRSYKTIRAHPRIGPTPEIMHVILDPKPYDKDDIHTYSLTNDTKDFDSYADQNIDEALDSDSITSAEAGMMKGYMS